MRLARLVFFAAVGLAFTEGPSFSQTRLIAVFNFQMKTETPDWVWLEKALSDRITMDFTVSKTGTILARDEMQMLAQQVHWAPELATDANCIDQVTKIRRMTHLISGTYGVENGVLRITAQIIDVPTRKELARKEISGKAEEVLDLQHRLSAQLINWFNKRPIEQILPELPAWTRSIPAAKALYTGMDLYDQGRYNEAWLTFRQASREDPQYSEARYWVGKMYYFMDRYEHARASLEEFAYVNSNHPRIADAVKEYVNTYEKVDTPADVLLQVYDDVRTRFSRLNIPKEGPSPFLTCEEWLRVKTGMLLAQLGRYQESIAIAGVLPELPGFSHFNARSQGIAMRSLAGAERILGMTPSPEVLKGMQRILTLDGHVVYFEEGNSTPKYLLGIHPWSTTSRCHYAFAPSGYRFKSIRFIPTMRDTEGTFAVFLPEDDRWYSLRDHRSKTTSISSARKDGLAFDNLPSTRIVRFVCSAAPKDPNYKPEQELKDVRVEAELEKLGPSGAIELACSNTGLFQVDVNGRPTVAPDNLLGPLSPGDYTIRMYPAEESSPFSDWTGKVSVEAGKTTRVVGHLPWKKGTPLASWSDVALVGGKYPGWYVSWHWTEDPLSCQADAHAIRVLWTCGGDIWSSQSTDGNSFSGPHKLPIPVSSGWIERMPKCIRDESGRFILAFISDRNGQKRDLPYVCWSRDFDHWSAPALIADRAIWRYDLAQDTRGRFFWADVDQNELRLFVSRDAYHWEKLALPPGPSPVSALDVKLVVRDDGRLEMIAALEPRVVKESTRPWKSVISHRQRGKLLGSADSKIDWSLSGALELWRYVSNDGIRWEPPQQIGSVSSPDASLPSLSAIHKGGQTTVAVFHIGNNDDWASLVLFQERANGQWQQSAEVRDALLGWPVMNYNPRWGHIFAWTHFGRWDDKGSSPPSGPFFTSTKNLEPLFSPASGLRFDR